MACDRNNLSALTYANGFTLWHYRTADKALDEPGYFNEAAGMLRVGDFVFANAGDESGVFVVAANSGGEVEVANISGFDREAA